MNGALEDRIAGWVAEMIGADTSEVDSGLPLSDSGLSSLQLLELSDLIQAGAGIKLEPTAVFDYPTIASLVDHVVDQIRRQSLAPQGAAIGGR